MLVLVSPAALSLARPRGRWGGGGRGACACTPKKKPASERQLASAEACARAPTAGGAQRDDTWLTGVDGEGGQQLYNAFWLTASFSFLYPVSVRKPATHAVAPSSRHAAGARPCHVTGWEPVAGDGVRAVVRALQGAGAHVAPAGVGAGGRGQGGPRRRQRRDAARQEAWRQGLPQHLLHARGRLCRVRPGRQQGPREAHQVRQGRVEGRDARAVVEGACACAWWRERCRSCWACTCGACAPTRRSYCPPRMPSAP